MEERCLIVGGARRSGNSRRTSSANSGASRGSRKFAWGMMASCAPGSSDTERRMVWKVMPEAGHSFVDRPHWHSESERMRRTDALIARDSPARGFSRLTRRELRRSAR